MWLQVVRFNLHRDNKLVGSSYVKTKTRLRIMGLSREKKSLNHLRDKMKKAKNLKHRHPILLLKFKKQVFLLIR